MYMEIEKRKEKNTVVFPVPNIFPVPNNSLVGCIEDLGRFSGISAICDFEAGDNQSLNSSGEAGNRNHDLLLRNPRA